jgi:signal transduction histidine kinase
MGRLNAYRYGVHHPHSGHRPPGTQHWPSGARHWPPWTGRRPSQTARDVKLAVIVGAFALITSTIIAERTATPVEWPAYLLLVGSAAALAVRRRHPVPVLVITAACALVYPHVTATPNGSFIVPMMITLFTAASLGLRAWAFGVGGVFLASFLTFGVLLGDVPREAVGWVPGWLVAVLVAGEVARSRHEYLVEAEQRAAEAERTREQAALRRASEERLQIAREVHDVLSHSISMINVQAGVALHLIDTKPEQARTALDAIKQASKDALRDLRTTLGVLRDVDAQDGGRAPAGGLHRLEELQAGAKAAGLELEITTTGEARELPAGVDLAAYRIVQESVSNIVRHSGASTGAISLQFSETELVIVVDNAPGTVDAAAIQGAGRGIRGMRERAEALGGDLDAGPRPEGGFRVRALLPLGDAP